MELWAARTNAINMMTALMICTHAQNDNQITSHLCTCCKLVGKAQKDPTHPGSMDYIMFDTSRTLRSQGDLSRSSCQCMDLNRFCHDPRSPSGPPERWTSGTELKSDKMNSSAIPNQKHDCMKPECEGQAEMLKLMHLTNVKIDARECEHLANVKIDVGTSTLAPRQRQNWCERM